MKQDVFELEALQEVHEQLVESNRELELDLREELEMAHAAAREVCIGRIWFITWVTLKLDFREESEMAHAATRKIYIG